MKPGKPAVGEWLTAHQAAPLCGEAAAFGGEY